MNLILCVISNDAGLLQELFEQTGASAQQLRLSHRFSFLLFICVTLTCSACCFITQWSPPNISAVTINHDESCELPFGRRVA